MKNRILKRYEELSLDEIPDELLKKISKLQIDSK